MNRHKGWTHAICVKCWNEKNPERQTTDRPIGELAACCFCGAATRSGIYVRALGDELPHCKGHE